MTQVADAAATYLRYGWSVIPVQHPSSGADGKRPALDEWRTYFERLPAEDELDYWFSGEPRNIAIVAGQVSQGLTIIDCDDERTYHTLCFLYPALAKSLTVRTGKGFHVYTYAPQAVATTSFELNGRKHHIKGEHSYCVAPPSLHESGRTYEWVDEDAPPIRLDLELLRKALARLGAKKREEGPRNPPGWFAEAIREGAKHGSRDDLTYRMAGHLRYFGCPYEDVTELLTLWAETRCDQPWGRADVEAKVRSAFRDYPTQQSPA